MPNSPRNITIIIPVYADWQSLKDCIESLKKYVDKHHKIMLINDYGPEADLLEKNIKKSIAGTKNFEYHRNAKNLGFLKTCNRAVNKLDKTDNDILLLNSDTEATAGFLEEMIEVLYDTGKIGVVSPRTNNATIATVPLSAVKQKGVKPGDSYKIWQKLRNQLPRYNEVPTAHGFCMLIRRLLIKKYGLFDEVFGKGYGEENDFCQRIAKQGYKSVLANHAYVFHLEAKSFTHNAKSKMLEKNLEILYDRWPNYRQSIRDYMEKALIREAEATYTPTSPKFYQNPKFAAKKLIKKNQYIYKIAYTIRNNLKK